MCKLRHFVAGVVTGALAFVVLFAAAANAQENCALAEGIVAELTGPEYREKPAFMGTVNTPRGPIPFMAFINSEKGTWTMLARPAPNIGCIIGAGQNFEWATEPFKPGSPS